MIPFRQQAGTVPLAGFTSCAALRRKGFRAMLDIDTIQSLYDLTAQTLYDAEIAHLPKRSRAEVEELIDRARQGDEEAREAFILSCLSHALGVARFVYSDRRLLHDDLLDLVQVASERMLEQLDKALSTS